MPGCSAGTCSAASATSRGLRASRAADARASTPGFARGLRAALIAVDAGRLRVAPAQEDVHTAVEDWLTRRLPGIGERLHTGRSRNDQVATDLRLYLKDRLLDAARRRARRWPRRCSTSRRATGRCSGPATPTSAGRCRRRSGSGPAPTPKGCWTPPSRSRGSGRPVDRSPLGSAAGYGVPLPLRREAAARALGFAGLDHNVATVQGGRGKLEAAALFWCTQLGHELARLSQDVILFSAEEFGYLVLPAELATGSSIMPHKRNPDLFELTRARAAALEGDLVSHAPDQGQARRRLPARLPAPQGAAHARSRAHGGDAGDGRPRGAAARGGSRRAAPPRSRAARSRPTR